MRNKNKMDSNKKGFLAAIFTCVLAIAIFAGLNMGNTPQEKLLTKNGESTAVAPEDYQTVTITKNAPPKPFPNPEAEEDQQKGQREEKTSAAHPEEKKETTKETPVPAQKPSSKATPEETAEPSKTEKKSEDAFNENTDYAETANFDAEDEGDFLALEWPLKGEIVMDYSTDKAIYDVTLEQYRTNNSVSIGAEAGTEVKAAGDGVVDFVGYDSQNGNTVVINHGDGWKTTYSQLEDGVSVAKGDSVQAGQVIGCVGQPSMYSVLEGTHLEFQISRDDQTVDPKVALVQD